MPHDGRMNGKEFRTQLETIWATRPVRPAAPRTIAGVCAGFGDRYRVDPTLVKVAFVVATLLGGSGLILYIAAWVAMPSSRSAVGSDGRADTGSDRRGVRTGHPRKPALLLLIPLVIVAVSAGPNSTWGGSGLVGAILMLLGWWLLYQRTPDPMPGTSADTLAGTDSPLPVERFERWTPRAVHAGTAVAGEPGGAGSATPNAGIPAAADDGIDRPPPSWDPLGAARFAWDLPEPTEPQPPVTAPRRGVGRASLIVIGTALVVAAVGTAAHQAGVEWFTTARVLALALTVVAAGLVVVGLRRRPHGRRQVALVPICIALGVAVIVATVAVNAGNNTGWNPLPAGGVGDRSWKPLHEDDIRAEYTVGMGQIELDLRDVDLTADRSVELRTGVGEITVRVPKDMNVTANCDTGVGEYHCPEGMSVGTNGPDAPVLTINAHSGAGEVEVTR